MELKFVLDFDGVLFNSAFEAYSVCNKATVGRAGYRQDVTFEEFSLFRSVVTDAWQYNRLYEADRRLMTFDLLPEIEPDYADWDFSKAFFTARAEMMEDPDWPKVMAPYDFFFQLRPLLAKHADKFVILSTRNVESIRRTLAFFDADVLPIFGQEDIRKYGSKLRIAEEEGWLERGRFFVVYVDDMNSHLEPFEGRVHLPLHANWGYDRSNIDGLNEHQILTIIGSMLKLSGSK
jgi:hypothetical protein